MATLKGLIPFPSRVHAPLKKTAGHLQGGFWNCRPRFKSITGDSGLFYTSRPRSNWPICCSLNSPSGDSDMEDVFVNFSAFEAAANRESTEDYVNCSVIEAVSVRGEPHGLIIKMLDGTDMRCVFNRDENMALRETNPYPVIVLKMEDGSGLFFAIDTVEKRNAMLMDVVRGIETVETTAYKALKVMIDTMGYEVRLVRIERRNQVFVAKLYLSQVGDEQNETKIVKIRLSDAIIIAVRCKAQIQVNKRTVYNEAIRVVGVGPSVEHRPVFNSPFEYLDWVIHESDYEEEFGLIRNMTIAASEERYEDAARYRDMLYQLWQKQKRQTK